jgi:hypothetical protein
VLGAVEQGVQLRNPDSRVSLEDNTRTLLLSAYVRSTEGLSTGDNPRYMRVFWEMPQATSEWSLFQGAPLQTRPYGGCEEIVLWASGRGELARDPQARIQGESAWGKKGVVVGRMRSIRSSLYLGGLYDKTCVVLTPKNQDHLAAIWHFCASPEYERQIRVIDTKLSVATGTVAQVPFDIAYWQKVAEEAGPLPEPYSNDPTQWLFKGDPTDSTEPLQVAVARLLGYEWPQQEPDRLSRLADPDGIVTLPAIGGERPAAERLRSLLATAYGSEWSPAMQDRLLAAPSVGYAGKSMEEWLRDGFFPQHCKLFHNRPFIWHIWDGRKDGFSALVNYHRLDYHLLNTLIHTSLGRWINTQRDAVGQGTAGADGRLVAALELQKKLEAIRDGEKPYDIYVRWKPLHKQPIGWNPDLNDGVRLNVRPFVEAGVLRSKFTINWNKDRGTNPDGFERLNDVHRTIAEKQAARRAAAVPVE